MADRHYLIQAVLPYPSGLPEDVAINTFHWFVPDGADVGAFTAQAATRTIAFYNDDPPTLSSNVASFINLVSRETDACKLRIFEVSATGVMTPAAVVDWTLANEAGGTSLPLEVAICSSYVGYPADMDGLGPVPVRRRRGRLYLGPLISTVMTPAEDEYPTVDEGAVNVIASATRQLSIDNWASAGVLDGAEPTWCVWSRAAMAGGASIAGQMTAIYQGWVDNEFDTQRRRQVRATERNEWLAP